MFCLGDLRKAGKSDWKAPNSGNGRIKTVVSSQLSKVIQLQVTPKSHTENLQNHKFAWIRDLCASIVYRYILRDTIRIWIELDRYGRWPSSCRQKQIAPDTAKAPTQSQKPETLAESIPKAFVLSLANSNCSSETWGLISDRSQMMQLQVWSIWSYEIAGISFSHEIPTMVEFPDRMTPDASKCQASRAVEQAMTCLAMAWGLVSRASEQTMMIHDDPWWTDMDRNGQ